MWYKFTQFKKIKRKNILRLKKELKVLISKIRKINSEKCLYLLK